MVAIKFTSLWVPILDELRFANREPCHDVLGGSGTFATLGARILCPYPSSKSIGWVCLAGEDDFPASIEELLGSWNLTLEIRKLPEQRTTRGLLEYEDSTFGPKRYRHVAPPLPIGPEALKNTPMLDSASFHFFLSPSQILTSVPLLHALRSQVGITGPPPLIVFEPGPLYCDPSSYTDSFLAAHLVDVYSPNHIELAKILGEADETKLTDDYLEKLAGRYVDSGIGVDGKGVIIMRAGERGCFVAGRERATKWFPPYWGRAMKETKENVVDPTGAGNAFLGGYARGLIETGSHEEAACWGSVAASFVVEQLGVPKWGKDKDGRELWNGQDAAERLKEYKRRVESQLS